MVFHLASMINRFKMGVKIPPDWIIADGLISEVFFDLKWVLLTYMCLIGAILLSSYSY